MLKIQHISAIIIASTSIIFASCSKQNAETAPYDAPLVVEGWIENGKTPVVMVTSGIEVSDNKRKIEDLAYNILRYAEVSIEHDGVTYRLSARLSDEYTLQNYFTTGDLKGEVGGVYKLKVKWEGKTATATATIPQPQHLGKLSAIRTQEQSDSSYVLQAHISDDHSCDRFYKFFVRDTVAFPGYSPAFLGTISNRNRPDEFDYTIENGVNYFKHHNTRLFKKGRIITVKMATIDETIYDFFKKVDQNSMCAVLPFVTYVSNVKGNVDGALGYWAGYGIEEKEICVE